MSRKFRFFQVLLILNLAATARAVADLPQAIDQQNLNLAATRTGGAPASNYLENASTPEPYKSGWEFVLDNDAFSLLRRDSDYTGGFMLSLSGHRAAEYPYSIDPWLSRLDQWTGLDSLKDVPGARQTHNIVFGLASYTPKNIQLATPIYNERPYASVLFMANSQQTVIPEQEVAHQTTLTLGVLGLKVAKDLQDAIHSALGQNGASGWDNQISSGGELTARYTVSAQRAYMTKYNNPERDIDVVRTMDASIGYKTDFGAGLAFRIGRIRSTWWSYNRSQPDYLNMVSPVLRSGSKPRDEFFLWGGINARVQLYNALLQGQFRDSAVTFSWEQQNHFLLSGWLGLNRQYRNGLRVAFVIRANTPELNTATEHTDLWGSFIVGRSF
ncbi:MAG: lipid A deacylase LpxR family protein [Acidiferrobacteraceae bacterium]|jgi:hypothetical protein